MDTIYIIDTSEWINLRLRYPKENFPDLWNKIESLISERKIISPMEVRNEIERGCDELIPWVREHRDMFHHTLDMIPQIQQILNKHPTLIDPNDDHEDADPHVIALARLYLGRLNLTPIIVTDENIHKESRIPFVARSYGVQSYKLLEMIQQEGWIF